MSAEQDLAVEIEVPRPRKTSKSFKEFFMSEILVRTNERSRNDDRVPCGWRCIPASMQMKFGSVSVAKFNANVIRQEHTRSMKTVSVKLAKNISEICRDRRRRPWVLVELAGSGCGTHRESTSGHCQKWK